MCTAIVLFIKPFVWWRSRCRRRRGLLNSLTSLFLRAFLQWQVVTGMEAEQIIESLARAPNAVCSSHLLLIDRRTPVDLWRHKFAFLVIFKFNLQKLIIFVNSIKRIRAGTFLELTSETAICNNLTAKFSVKCICIKWFAICASLKLTDLITLISIFYNLQDHKLDWDTVDRIFNYAPLKKRGLVIVEIGWSTWKPILFFHNLRIKSSILGEW